MSGAHHCVIKIQYSRLSFSDTQHTASALFAAARRAAFCSTAALHKRADATFAALKSQVMGSVENEAAKAFLPIESKFGIRKHCG
jgi:hypothetical protein